MKAKGLEPLLFKPFCFSTFLIIVLTNIYNGMMIKMINKSPSGSLCPNNYKGGELHPLKYGSYFADKSKLFIVMKA